MIRTGRFNPRHFRYLFIYVDHLGRRPDDLRDRHGFGQFGPDGGGLDETEFLFDTAQNFKDVVDNKRFRNVIEGAVMNGMNGRLHRSVRRHDHNLGVCINRFHVFEQAQAGVVTEINITDEISNRSSCIAERACSPLVATRKG
jgi:hypothetical protein